MKQLGWVKGEHRGNRNSEETCLGAFKESRTPLASLGDTLGKTETGSRILTLVRGVQSTDVKKIGTQDIYT